MKIQFHVTAGQLRRAVRLKEEIETLESELSKLLGSTKGLGGLRRRRTGTRVMSAAGKQRIAAAQKRRWAAWRKQQLANA